MDVDVHMKFHGKDINLAMANIVLKTEKGLIVVQRRGDTQLDNNKIKKIAEVSHISVARKEALASIGLEAGIVPPIGYDVKFFMDEKVLENEEIYTGSGDR